MTEELECYSCEAKYAVEVEEFMVREGYTPRFCPFCGEEHLEEVE